VIFCSVKSFSGTVIFCSVKGCIGTVVFYSVEAWSESKVVFLVITGIGSCQKLVLFRPTNFYSAYDFELYRD
jgi:hypothetical protein